ncbi:MAG: lipoyl domain-containing protein [Geminicoccaceae bacterium]|nr:lipoyl domain-containing protein [Geminicoccaceae bacterium]MCX7630892.1 lipoyl domain-containing protein [Geminicoccaceae bacterium]MDW8370181.1 lipoyl domain-containing protein [Geminicoccaceae bacterium]
MKVVLKLPRISMNMQEGTLVAWRVAPGAAFKAGAVLYEVETEKVTSEVTAPCDGILLEILAEAGSDLEVGDPVCRIEQTGG